MRFGAKRKFSTMLMVSIFLSLATTHILQVEALPQKEIAYDDGTTLSFLVPLVGRYFAVNFSLPEGWVLAKLLKAKFYIHTNGATFTVHVYMGDGSTELIRINCTPTAPPFSQMFEVDLSTLNIIVAKNFYICFEGIDPYKGTNLGIDGDPPFDGRSFWKDGSSGSWREETNGDYMIRAVVEFYIPSREPDWSTPDEVIDLDVSADGSIVAAATSEGLKVYDAAGNQLWNWSQTGFTAVSVSDNGNVVVAAIYNGTYGWSHLLFWKNAKTLSGNSPPDWSSQNLWGLIWKEALDVSSDGSQVVAVGTGQNVFYWNDTLTLSGSNIGATWTDFLGNYQLEFVDISDDGDVIAILGEYRADEGVYYDAFVYKSCNTRTGPQGRSYNLNYSFGDAVRCGGIALSDDGQYVVAGVGNCVYFFNMSLTEGWAPQWKCSLEEFELVAAVDISGDGNTVVAVTNDRGSSPSNLLIFQNAVSKVGIASSDHKFTLAGDYTDCDYVDVSIDDAGNLAAAGTGDYLFAFNASTGEPLWLYNGTYPKVSKFVRVSEDGQVIASAGSETDSLHFFSLVPKTAVVTFDQVGVGSDYSGPVLKVDGVNYTVSSLPASFVWGVGSNHTFEFYEVLYADGKRYVWKETKGLSTGRSGTITVPDAGGYVNATYKTQYLVTVTASPSEAQGGTFQITFTSCGTTFINKTGRTPYSVWIDAGTTVTVSNPQQEIKGYKFQSYSPSDSLYIDEPKIITLIYAQPPVGGYIVPADTLMPASAPSVTTASLLILGLTAVAALTVAVKKKRNL